MDNEMIARNNELSSVASAAMAKAEIESAYVMAYKRPRNMDDMRSKILAACKRPVFAETVEYSKPIGGTKITGASIRFVEVALQAAGNIRSNTQVVYEDETMRKIKVTVTDLETNISFNKEFTLLKQVERSKVKDGQVVLGQRINSSGNTTYIVAASEDEMAIKQTANESKIIRNLGLRLIPQDIIEEALDVARETRSKSTKDPAEAKNKVIDAFASLGIKPSDIEKYLGKPIAQVIPKELDELRTIYTAIKEGDSKWSDYLETVEPTEKEKEPEKPKSSLKDKLKEKSAVKPDEPSEFEKKIRSYPPEAARKAIVECKPDMSIPMKDYPVEMQKALIEAIEKIIASENKTGDF